MWDKYYSVLLYVLEKAGLFDNFKTSTTKLAEELKSTQQTISRKLIEMEKLGLIKRELKANGVILSLDEKGRDYFKKKYAILKRVFEKKNNKLKGAVKTGMDEGKYYMALPEYQIQFKKKLGFKPYAGTLNLKIDRKKVLEFINDLQPVLISGFKTKERTYGSIKCYKIKIRDFEGAIIIPERATHPEDIIEIIAPVYLRGYYKLKDNDIIEVEK